MTTTVSGAWRGGVYYSIEAPTTFNPDHKPPPDVPDKDSIKALFVPRKNPIEFINLIPFDRVVRGYTPKDWEKAHRLICVGEQRMALYEALKGIKPSEIKKGFFKASEEVLSRPIEAFQFFLESREAYHVDLKQMLKSTKGATKKSALEPAIVRQEKRELKLIEFGMTALHAVQTELALLPSAKRPAIPDYPLLDGKVILKL